LRNDATHRPQMILGWREWVWLPALDIGPVHAKLDTGARSSALHVVEMEPFRKRGREWVRFRVDPDPRRPDWIVECESVVEDQRVVRNPGGRGQLRVLIRTEIELAGQRWPIDLTLTNRSEMRFRMLIGREALAGRVLVDAKRSDLGGRPPGSSRRRKKVSR
jgi:hypothetical protein